MPGRFPGAGPFGFRSDFNPMQRRPQMASVLAFEERNNTLLDTPSLLLQAVIVPGDKTQEGQLVEAVTLPWFDIIELLSRDPAVAHQIQARKWEEIIAGAYERAGFDEVTLTPRSGDLGRDVIAVKRGLGIVRVIDQVKAYGPGHLVNAIASHSVELDDVDVLALFHFSPPVVSAALAVAEREQVSGTEFIAAVVAGCEMMARASAATNPSLRDRGYHTTPVCGVFGAAIAAARLLKLDREATVAALGMAGAQSSGLMEMYGPSMHKRFNPGPAARNGVTAALMARLGFTAAATIFEGERGFCRAFSDHSDLDALTKDLGVDYPVYIEFKPYSCARPIHNAIDCALNIRKELEEPLSSVVAITVHRHPAWAHYHQNAAPTTYHEAQVSLPYSVAVALLEGGALLPQYQPEKLRDPEISRLARMVKIVPDASLPRGVSCLMTLEVETGAVYRSQVDHPRGSIASPMTADEMNNKVHLLADNVIGRSSVNALIDMVRNLTSVSHIGELTRLVAEPLGRGVGEASSAGAAHA